MRNSNIKILYWYAINISTMLKACVENMSIVMCGNAKVLTFSCLDEKELQTFINCIKRTKTRLEF